MSVAHGARPPRKPKIILVMADDPGWKELGSYGQKKIRTPHLDRMAAEGMRFTQFYTGAPVCAPARCNLMTGKHGGHAYIRNNGEMKEHQYELKGSCYEGGVREPFIVRWLGKVPAGTVSDHIGAHYDVLPTLAEIAGADVPAGVDGISILPELTGNRAQQKKHEFIFWAFAGYGGQIAVRMGDWKGMELYNLRDDLSETTDVADRHPEIVAKMAAVILRERKRPALEKFSFGTYRD
jgi:arylsulfatase A-like enzyme